MPSQVKTFALLSGLRGAASIRLRPQQKSRSVQGKEAGARRIRCSASHGIFGFHEDMDALRAAARS